jgi:hypothetical protein
MKINETAPGAEVTEPTRREWVYVQRPRDYEIAGCPCGNDDPDFSEFAHMLWCPVCQKDFIPEHNGIFDGPIPVHGMRLIGVDLRQVNLTTGEIREP